MSDCLFCKFVSNELKTEKIYEDENVLGFRDIYPQAKEHYLFISKTHTTNVNEMNINEVGYIYKAIKSFTESSPLHKEGFRVVTNTGEHGGQTIFHTHFHVLGGEQLKSFGA